MKKKIKNDTKDKPSLKKTNKSAKKVEKKILKNIFNKNNKEVKVAKKIREIAAVILVVVGIVSGVIISKYKPMYVVKQGEEIIGYVENKDSFETRIEEEILTPKEECAIFVTIAEKPTFEFGLYKDIENNEEEILIKLKEEAETEYKIYAILVNNEEKSYVKTYEEAENIAKELETEGVSVTAIEKYTNNIAEINTSNLEEAKTSINEQIRSIKEEQKRRERATVNGVYLSVLPVAKPNITSRYGIYESDVRDHVHSGLDLAAPTGTQIRAAAAGTVRLSTSSSGYGKMVVIDHGNGVETYYAHCDTFLVSNGSYVEAGEVIATVGTTGHATGSHCHFEVRVNGSTVNPQRYLY